MIDRIDAEYLRYFTPTGRPTGEWASAINRLRAADDEVARAAPPPLPKSTMRFADTRRSLRTSRASASSVRR